MPNIQDYRQTHIMTASPMQLVILLYDEAIKTLKEAETAFSIEDPTRFQEVSNRLIHAEDIITELAVSLDMDKGGEIANNLHKLYDFMQAHLSQANARKSIRPVIEVRNLMEELREAWQQVAEKEPSGEDSMHPLDIPVRNVLAAG